MVGWMDGWMDEMSWCNDG